MADPDPEPAENISGGAAGGGHATTFVAAEEPATRAEAVVDRLGELYWQKTYGGQPAFACLVRTVLSQNTGDVGSQAAHDALLERYGDGDGEPADRSVRTDGNADLAAALATAEPDALADTIAEAGLHNQKAERLVAIAEDVVATFDGAGGFDEFVKSEPPDAVRERLLSWTGIGPKTADCVLLFAGGREGVFPVDTHVHRIYRRLGVAPPDADHERIREVLERDVPAEKCGFGHTASIQFGREYCTARRPACLDGPEACPLADLCDRVGVDAERGEVVDPAEAAADDGR
ncbi:MAG: endonuclease III [Halobacteriaceae archaeon]